MFCQDCTPLAASSVNFIICSSCEVKLSRYCKKEFVLFHVPRFREKTLNPKSKPLHFFLYQVNLFLRHNTLKYQVVSQPSLFGLGTFFNFRLQKPNFLNFESKTTTTADDQASRLGNCINFLNPRGHL